MLRKALALTLITLFVSVLAGCSGSVTVTSDSGSSMQAQASPKSGTFTGNGWGTVELKKSGNQYTGTYTDTWGPGKGTIKLFPAGDGWEGTWEEASINRGGKLYRIRVSDRGETVSGLYEVTRSGGKSTFSDQAFTWKYQN